MLDTEFSALQKARSPAHRPLQRMRPLLSARSPALHSASSVLLIRVSALPKVQAVQPRCHSWRPLHLWSHLWSHLAM